MQGQIEAFQGMGCRVRVLGLRAQDFRCKAFRAHGFRIWGPRTRSTFNTKRETLTGVKAYVLGLTASAAAAGRGSSNSSSSSSSSRRMMCRRQPSNSNLIFDLGIFLCPIQNQGSSRPSEGPVLMYVIIH